MLNYVKIGLAWTLPLLSVAMRAALVMYSHGVGVSMAASATGSLVECHGPLGGTPPFFCPCAAFVTPCVPFVALGRMKKEPNSFCTLLAYS